MMESIRSRFNELRDTLKSGDSPEVTEARLRTSEMNHRTEISQRMLRDVDSSLDHKRTGFFLADAMTIHDREAKSE